eukprot:COSAG01_NODE_11144_length_1997_cov_6.611164_2_plen_83_part_00
MTGMSATDTPALAWRGAEGEEATATAAAAAAAKEEEEETQRSPGQRRLEGLFAIDPADFAPGACVRARANALRPTSVLCRGR